MLLVIAEQRGGKLNRASWETVAAAQQIGGGPLVVAVAGSGLSGVATELAAADVAEVLTIENPALEPYTPDGHTPGWQAAIAEIKPALGLLPHTHQTPDFPTQL